MSERKVQTPKTLEKILKLEDEIERLEAQLKEEKDTRIAYGFDLVLAKKVQSE